MQRLASAVTRTGHAEIAGGGLGGLTAAAALGQGGWSVRVHERAGSVRATGSGIFIAENGLRVLDALGACDEALEGGHRFYRRETRDHRNRVIATDTWPPEAGQRIYVIARERLVQALRAAAERAGAEICTSSEVTGLDADGRLSLASGDAPAGDLVIGADGVNSRVRAALPIPVRRRSLHGGAIRAIVPWSPADHPLPESTFAEYWTGPRRVFYAPISPNEAYIALMTVTADAAGTREPPDLDSWTRSFPFLDYLFRRIDNPLRWTAFEEIRMPRWHQGRVALIGDAAHAMAPNLGQGGGTAMMDGISLAANVVGAEDIEGALVRWEARERVIVDRIQFLSWTYGELSRWPAALRNLALWALGVSGWMKRVRKMGASFVPDGVGPGRSASPESSR